MNALFDYTSNTPAITLKSKSDYEAQIASHPFTVIQADHSPTFDPNSNPVTKALTPVLNSPSAKYYNVAQLHFNIDEIPELAEELGIPKAAAAYFVFVDHGEVSESFAVDDRVRVKGALERLERETGFRIEAYPE